jgi:hypothetical protein
MVLVLPSTLLQVLFDAFGLAQQERGVHLGCFPKPTKRAEGFFKFSGELGLLLVSPTLREGLHSCLQNPHVVVQILIEATKVIGELPKLGGIYNCFCHQTLLSTQSKIDEIQSSRVQSHFKVTVKPTTNVSLTPVWVIFAITIAGSSSTGLFWNALGFIAKHAYGFSRIENLTLYLAMGLVYAASAWKAGSVGKIIGWSDRGGVVWCLLGMAVGLAVPGILPSKMSLWIAGIWVSGLSALLWPVVHAYLAGGRPPDKVAKVQGVFNLIWMTSVTIPMFILPPFLDTGARGVFLVSACTLFMVLPLAFWLPCVTPSAFVDPSGACGSAGHPEWQALLVRSRRWLVVTYLFMSAFPPLLPYAFEASGIASTLETPLTGTWMVVRVVFVAFLWRTTFWQGHRPFLIGAGLAGTLGFGLALGAGFLPGPPLPWMFFGFILFGLGAGASYHAALAYGMVVGEAEVDAGGTFEAMIGLGYAGGPAAGLLGVPVAALLGISPGVAATVLLAGPALMLPWLRVSENSVEAS